MANWARLQEQLTGLPVVKRDKHSIHFDKGNGEIVANFSGTPCHYEENGIWKALDTAIVELEDGSLGAKGVPVRLNLNGLVRIINEQNEDLYSQVTTRVGVFNSTTRNLVDYINLPVGQVQDDLLVKDTDLYSHTLRLTETGLREEIVIKSKPSFITDKANLWLVLDTVVTGITFEDGWLDQFEIAQMHFPPPTATDAEGREGTTKRYAKNINGVQHLFTGLKFSELYRAAYPVTIDPDFTASTACYSVAGHNLSGDYSAARSTSQYFRDYSALAYANKGVGQLFDGGSIYDIQRMFLKFDTSSIASGSTVTDVTFSGALQANYASDAFDVQVVMQDWSGQDPITDINRETAFDNCLSGTSAGVWINTGTSKTRRIKYTSGSLNTALVTVAGTTYLSLRSSLDYAGTAPDSNDQISIFTANEATYQKPMLTITYTAGSTGVPKHFLHYARLRSN